MKLSEIVKPKVEKYNFEKIYKSLPKEFLLSMKNVSVGARELSHSFKKWGNMKDDIAPFYCEYYYAATVTEDNADDADYEQYAESFLDKFEVNFVDKDNDDEVDEYDEFKHDVLSAFEEMSEVLKNSSNDDSQLLSLTEKSSLF